MLRGGTVVAVVMLIGTAVTVGVQVWQGYENRAHQKNFADKQLAREKTVADRMKKCRMAKALTDSALSLAQTQAATLVTHYRVKQHREWQDKIKDSKSSYQNEITPTIPLEIYQAAQRDYGHPVYTKVNPGTYNQQQGYAPSNTAVSNS
ncbi:hypothetical protein KKA47_01460 [bacterium]|nr:hypothetical protein [bacterium]